jgi:enediyne biosynthesis protein E4
MNRASSGPCFWCVLALSIQCILAVQGPWSEFPGGRRRSVHPVKGLGTSGRASGFELLGASNTGVSFTNRLSENAAAENQIRLNGSGVALGDVDGDGRVDIYLCGLENGNALFRSRGGFQFTDSTREAGVECPGQFSTGAAFADIDGDFDLDLLVNGIGTGTRLFLNDGKGHFAEKQDSGLMRKWCATSLALADANGDGLLDLYVANYRTTTIRSTGFALLNLGGKRMIRPEDRDSLELTPEGRVLEHGEPHAFYINEGSGKFARVSWTAGGFLNEDGVPLRKAPHDWGLSVMFRDLNQDTLPDLYVCNDFHSPDRIWLNTGEGSFRAAPKLMLRHTSTFSMSVDFADLDRDGREDFFLADMLDPRRLKRMAQFSGIEPNPATPGVFDDRPQYDRNTLFWNRGNNTYSEIAYYAGLEAAGWSWCAAFLDVDLDGFEDLLLTTGHMFDTQDLDAADRIQAAGPWRTVDIPRKLLMFPRLSMPKAAFRNDGKLHFQPMAKSWGFSDEDVSHGMAMADLDEDGDLDLVVNNLNGPAGIYRNESDLPRVCVRLRGQAPNTRGIGARVSLFLDDFVQAQEIIAGGRYLSSDDPARVFAWRQNARIARLEVRWRSGARTVVENVAANFLYEIEEPADAIPLPQNQKAATPLFADASALLNHYHQERPFDDFQRQPLLPKKLSHAGPGIAWFDLDHDSWDDLLITSGAGAKLSILKNQKGRRFEPWPSALTNMPSDEQTAVLALGIGDAVSILTAFSHYEKPSGDSILRAMDVASGFSSEIARTGASLGALASADYDGDGDLDLFGAGRCIPGRYPGPASSFLWQREGMNWKIDPVNTELLREAGLINAALFSDLNNDGFPELILACEWGPVRVFQNDRGKFLEVTRAAGLAAFTGWWNGVATCDLDEDGQLDIIAGNWGLNSKYRASPEQPVRMHYGDLQGLGSTDILESQFDVGLQKEVPERDLRALRAGVPLLVEKFRTYTAYATAGVDELLTGTKNPPRMVEANTLSSMVFFKRGSRFEARALPVEAQIAPVFAVVPADFNGDGHDDVFLSQNFFPVEPTTSRNDAGQGLLLFGNGRGDLLPVSASESGLEIFGDQRGAAACDFDHDGRLDLVVSQNSAATRLFRNDRGHAGRRVRLDAGEMNPFGIGSAVRLRAQDSAGPWREVQAGAGYCSQNSPILVLHSRSGAAAAQIEVRWPGGTMTTFALPPKSGELTVTKNGLVEAR